MGHPSVAELSKGGKSGFDEMYFASILSRDDSNSILYPGKVLTLSRTMPWGFFKLDHSHLPHRQ